MSLPVSNAGRFANTRCQCPVEVSGVVNILYELRTSYLARHRPITRSNSERTSTSRNLSQKHIIACRRAAEVTARYEGLPAIVSSTKRCATSQDTSGCEEHRSTDGSLSTSMTQGTKTIRRCMSENGRLTVRGTSFKRTLSGEYLRHKEANFFNINAAWLLGPEDTAYMGTTDLRKLYTELRMTVKLSSLPVLGHLKSRSHYQ